MPNNNRYKLPKELSEIRESVRTISLEQELGYARSKFAEGVKLFVMALSFPKGKSDEIDIKRKHFLSAALEHLNDAAHMIMQLARQNAQIAFLLERSLNANVIYQAFIDVLNDFNYPDMAQRIAKGENSLIALQTVALLPSDN